MLPADVFDLDALLERYERPLVRYAGSLLGDFESAKDVVQETFMRLVRRTSAGGDGAVPPAPAMEERHLEAWLFTVCRNCAIDHQRKHARIIHLPVLDDDRVDELPNPAARLEQSDSAALIFRLLEKLPPNQREVIRLKFQNDLSYKEIADITGLTVTNVGFLMHTGLRKLRSLLGDARGDRWAAAAAASEA